LRIKDKIIHIFVAFLLITSKNFRDERSQTETKKIDSSLSIENQDEDSRLSVEDGRVLQTLLEKRGGGGSIGADAFSTDRNPRRPPTCKNEQYDSGLKESPGGFDAPDSDGGSDGEDNLKPWELGHKNENVDPDFNSVDYLVVDKSGRMLKIDISDLRKKAYHILTFLTDEELIELEVDVDAVRMYEKGYQWDHKKSKHENYIDKRNWEEARDQYFSDSNNMPDKALHIYAQRIIKFCTKITQKTNKDTFLYGPGSMGSGAGKQTGGTLYIDQEEGIVVYRNRNGYINVSVKLSDNQMNRLLFGDENEQGKMHLFPGLGPHSNK